MSDPEVNKDRERVLANILINKKTGCWEWQKAINNAGYGMMRNWQAAHTTAYKAWKGTYPPGWQIDHLCRVKHCVNPDHLEAVPRGVNVSRGFTARRGQMPKDKLRIAKMLHAEVTDRMRGAR